MHPWLLAVVALDIANERTREIEAAQRAAEVRAAARDQRPNPPAGPLRRLRLRSV